MSFGFDLLIFKSIETVFYSWRILFSMPFISGKEMIFLSQRKVIKTRVSSKIPALRVLIMQNSAYKTKFGVKLCEVQKKQKADVFQLIRKKERICFILYRGIIEKARTVT
jgi:hypothetical protein